MPLFWQSTITEKNELNIACSFWLFQGTAIVQNELTLPIQKRNKGMH